MGYLSLHRGPPDNVPNPNDGSLFLHHHCSRPYLKIIHRESVLQDGPERSYFVSAVDFLASIWDISPYIGDLQIKSQIPVTVHCFNIITAVGLFDHYPQGAGFGGWTTKKLFCQQWDLKPPHGTSLHARGEAPDNVQS